LSRNFADGKAAGVVSKQLQQGGELDLRSEDDRFTLWLDGACVADSPVFADAAARDSAIETLKLALASQQD